MKKLIGLIAFTGLICSVTGALYAAMTAEEVLNDLHHSNRDEETWGQFAQDRGYTDDTRNFGKTLINDHRSADEKVQRIASNEGVALTEPGESLFMKAEMKKMEYDKGANFDAAFAKLMVKEHRSDIKKMQKALKQQLPQDVHDLIVGTLPTLQKHLNEAEKIRMSTENMKNK